MTGLMRMAVRILLIISGLLPVIGFVGGHDAALLIYSLFVVALLNRQRVVEGRSDVLCYTTPPLERPVEVTGPVQLLLYASSSALDTDFTGKLVDVAPDGRAEILTEGILRARYRDSWSSPSLLEPGRIYELRLDLWATANVFAAGHRIRLEVSSSNFPRFDRNPNTGGHCLGESRTPDSGSEPGLSRPFPSFAPPPSSDRTSVRRSLERTPPIRRGREPVSYSPCLSSTGRIH